MVEIPEYKRDSSKDYLFVLKSLNEIPFPVGQNLLVDFLHGELDNVSVEKNSLYDYNNFGALSRISKEEIFGLVESGIAKGFVEISNSVFNKFSKVLFLSKKGRENLLSPSVEEATSFQKSEEDCVGDLEKNFEKFEDFLEGLNSDQKRAIVSEGKKILCVAGAGSGKTSVLTKRIEFLNKFRNVPSEKILAITFTRKAKEEMEKRLEASGVRVVVETFNSFCEKILIKHCSKIYSRRMRVANFRDMAFAVSRALDFEGLDAKKVFENYFNETQKRNRNFYQLQNMFVADCFSVFDFFKFAKLSLPEFNSKYFPSSDENADVLKRVVSFLFKYMPNAGMRTYADQIGDVITFFGFYPRFVPRFDYVFVDEFQDVNARQIELLEFLNTENLFCVGDPRQSIFGWRGAELKHLSDFESKYENCERIILKKNYRSNKKILNIMNLIVEKMKLPFLESTFEEEGKAELCRFSKEIDEFDFVASKIFSMEIPDEGIFVLARTNRQIETLSELFKKKGINFRIKEDEAKNFEVGVGEVVLSTVHAIKGMEARDVFVVGCTSNNFPCKSGDHPVIEKMQMYDYDREEEESRLFYVAVSRAKRNLCLTYSGKRPTYFLTDAVKKEFEFLDLS